MTKSELRGIYKQKRSELSRADVYEKSQQIADRFFESVDLRQVGTLHCFLSIAKFNEIDTSLILARLWREFPSIRTAVPRIRLANDELESVSIHSETEVVESRWGIREPIGDDLVEPGAIDLVIVPLLCFDVFGHRVGYGKGFYDRLLAKCRPNCLKVGLTYFSAVPRILDAGDHDVAIDLCVSPDTVFRLPLP